MKKLILLFTLLNFLSCSQDENQAMQKHSIDGMWSFDSIKYETNSVWLRDFDLIKWELLKFTFQTNEDNTILILTENSPDFNIFPQSSTWELKSESNNIKVYKGFIEGFALEGVDYRNYFVTINEHSLMVSTLIEPDCPENVDCTLEICCDVTFVLKKIFE